MFSRVVAERCHIAPAKNDVIMPIMEIPTATCLPVGVEKNLNLMPIFS